MSKMEKSQKEFRDWVVGIAEDVNSEKAAEIKEEIDKKFSEYNQMSETDKARTYKQMVRQKKDGGGLRDPSQSKFAKALPYMLKSMVDHGGYSWQKAMELAEKGFQTGSKEVFKSAETQKAFEKFQQSDNGTLGGSLIPQDLSEDFIDFLYSRTVVRRLGAKVYDMPRGHLDIPKATGSTTASWIGEGNGADPSDVDFGTVRLEGKKLSVVNVHSNDLIREAPQNVQNIIANDMMQRAAVEEDSAFIRSDGSNGQPKGIRNLVDSGQVFERSVDGSSNVTLDTILADLMKAQFKVDDADIPVQTPGWIMSPRTFYYLMSLRGQDTLLFMPLLMDGALFGAEVGVTTSIPKNLDYSGDGTNDETEIYYGDFDKLAIGQSLDMRLVNSNEASIDLGNGTIKRLLQDDLSASVLFHKVDSALRYDKAFSVIAGVDYGADFGS